MAPFDALLSRRGLLTGSAALLAISGCSNDTTINPTGTPETARRSPPGGGPRLYLADFGAAADGTSDDRPALQAALDEARKRGGGTVIVPNAAVALAFRPGLASLGIPTGVGVRGEGPLSALLVSSSAEFASAFTTQGDNIAISDLLIRRMSPFDGGAIDVRAGKNILLERLVIDGASNHHEGVFHGVLLQGSNTDHIEGLRLLSSRITDCAYGLLQPSPQRVSVRDVFVNSTDLARNQASDLEFNAPQADNRDITVFNCSFTANAALGPEAGWGIGLANVQGAALIGNRFDGYAMSAIHVEDRSAEVRISQNSFVRVGRSPNSYSSAIIVLSGTNELLVSGNTIDLSQQENTVSGVWVGHGGAGEPEAITITDNAMLLKKQDIAVNIQGAKRVIQKRNVIQR